MKKEIKQHLKENKWVFLNALIITIVLEWTYRLEVNQVSEWIMEAPEKFIINVLIVCLVFLLIKNLLNNLWALFIGNTLFITIALINYYKFKLRQSVFLISDLKMFQEIIAIWDNIANERIISILFIGLALIVGVLLILVTGFKLFKRPLHFRMKRSFLTLLLLVFLGFSSATVTGMASVNETGYLNFIFNQIYTQINYELKIGLDEDLKKVFEENKEKGLTIDLEASQSDQPNIIVVMNEAFWDPRYLSKVTYSDNPLKNYDQLKEQSMSGHLIAPVYGGGTSNSEFEVLTGINARILADGSMMYDEMIENPMVSLASITHHQGYATSAIHPFKNWYYQRNKIYKYLGFDEFYSLEYFIDPEERGYYVSDAEVNEKILKQMNKTDQPDFIYAITMQNHGPYADERYGETDIKVSVEDDVKKMLLETYTQGIKEADESLKNLTDALEALEEPTILLFFGDHLPALNTQGNIYDEYQLEIPDEWLQASHSYTVPFLLWSNDNRIKKENLNINMNTIGPYLLKYAGLEQPKFYDFLEILQEKYPVIYNHHIYANHKLIEGEEGLEKYKEFRSIFASYQHAILKNDQRFIDKKWVYDATEVYNQQLKRIRIDEVIHKDNHFIIKGGPFYDEMKLYINEKETPYHRVDSENIKVSVESIDEDAHLRAVLYDDQENILAEGIRND